MLPAHAALRSNGFRSAIRCLNGQNLALTRGRQPGQLVLRTPFRSRAFVGTVITAPGGTEGACQEGKPVDEQGVVRLKEEDAHVVCAAATKGFQHVECSVWFVRPPNRFANGRQIGKHAAAAYALRCNERHSSDLKPRAKDASTQSRRWADGLFRRFLIDFPQTHSCRNQPNSVRLRSRENQRDGRPALDGNEYKIPNCVHRDLETHKHETQNRHQSYNLHLLHNAKAHGQASGLGSRAGHPGTHVSVSCASFQSPIPDLLAS